ncbi:hypothetical protein [Anaerosinus sp.]|uniref:hypothetical protein n=1 Tax=Selenobaculum sp. TaxID=3074374 RepID=UPI0015AE4FD1
MKRVFSILIILFTCFFSVVHADELEAHYNFLEPSDPINTESEERVGNENSELVMPVVVYSDYDYDYIIDSRHVKKIGHPYREKEKIVDVWVKQEASGNQITFYPSECVMNHYYLRLDKAQMQLVSQVQYDTSGNRSVLLHKNYIEDGWQDVIPMTKEYEMYQAIVKYAK